MLVVMTLVNESIPAETGMTIFRIDCLCGGIAVFGQTFVMLFTAITIAKDRSGAECDYICIIDCGDYSQSSWIVLHYYFSWFIFGRHLPCGGCLKIIFVTSSRVNLC